MTIPIFIGLPGSGKSSIAKLTADAFGWGYVSTDELFRKYRGVPEASQEEGGDLVRRFLSAAEKGFPHKHDALQKMAQPNPYDGKGRSYLHDSTLFRKIGEDVFRLFESEMIQWVHERGGFDRSIPDLSSSAILKPETRALFSHASFVLLDVPHEVIVKRLVGDFYKYEAQSAFAGESKPIRGGYEGAVRAALEANSLHREEIIRQTLSDLAQKHREERLDFYRGLQSYTVPVGPDETPEETQGRAWAIMTSVPPSEPEPFR